jgi:putative ABC transport system ATP-binding protein
MTEIIRTENLTKVYMENRIPYRALDGVSLIIESGEFTAIAGPSGSGKTTLLNLIGGLDLPTKGKVFLEGRNITELPQGELSNIRLHRLGFVFQTYNLIPVLSARENVEFVMQLQGVHRSERRERALRVLQEVGLEEFADRRPAELSGGQQQRVAVARAIVTSPSLVLADEPTANLDSKTAGALLDLMRKLNEEDGITFVFSTHDKLVMDKARRLVQLKDGALVDE